MYVSWRSQREFDYKYAGRGFGSNLEKQKGIISSKYHDKYF